MPQRGKAAKKYFSQRRRDAERYTGDGRQENYNRNEHNSNEMLLKAKGQRIN